MSSLTCGCGHSRAQHAYLGDGAYGVCWKSGCYCPGFEREKPLHLRDVSAPSAATEIAKPAADPSAGTPTPGAAASEPKSPVVADEAAAGAATCNHEKAGALPTEPPARPTQGGSTRMSTTEITQTAGETLSINGKLLMAARIECEETAEALKRAAYDETSIHRAVSLGRTIEALEAAAGALFDAANTANAYADLAGARDGMLHPSEVSHVHADVTITRRADPVRAAAQDDPRGEADNGRELHPAETTERGW